MSTPEINRNADGTISNVQFEPGKLRMYFSLWSGQTLHVLKENELDIAIGDYEIGFTEVEGQFEVTLCQSDEIIHRLQADGLVNSQVGWFMLGKIESVCHEGTHEPIKLVPPPTGLPDYRSKLWRSPDRDLGQKYA